MRVLLVLGLFWNCWACNAQQFSFSVETKGFDSNDLITLKKYHGATEIPVDSISGSGITSFVIDTEFGVDGLYLISHSPEATAEIIISGHEPGVRIIVEKKALFEGTLTISNSIENEAYEKFVSSYLDYERKFYQLASIQHDLFGPNVISNLGKQSDEMEETQTKFNDRLSEIQKLYPGTYTAKVLSPLVKLPIRTAEDRVTFETYTSFLNEHFWDNANLSNVDLLNHFILNEALKNYFRHFVPKREEDIRSAIDVLQSKSAGNDEVNNRIRSFLLRNFLNANATSLSSYVAQLSNDGNCSLDISEEQLAKLTNLRSVVDSGSVVPEVALSDRYQNKIELAEIYGNYKVTLVLFWSAKCVHCIDEIPVLHNIYKQFHSAGLEVYAINLDENKFDFRDFLDTHPNPWVNVTDVGSIRDSEVVKLFSIQKTPSIFLVDGSGYVIGKNIFGEKLATFVANYLESD